MPKKLKKEKMLDYDLASFLKKEKIDNKELMTSIISIAKNFCQDNILSLSPLLKENKNIDAVQERIFYFELISNLLNSIDKLIAADVTFITQEKKKATKKKSKEK
ncbi:MAG: hypothetical protein IJ752_07145 [Alphaproteobacteria bacterium]|nr:hypothetical protein [Alphaproteobacteria bacterium]